MSKSMCGVIFCQFCPPSSVSFYLKRHIVAGGYAKFFPECSQKRLISPRGLMHISPYDRCIFLECVATYYIKKIFLTQSWGSTTQARNPLFGVKNHQDAASVVELAEITCQNWSISGETGHKSLYLTSRIADQLVEVN